MLDRAKKVSVVIPVFNEAESLSPLFEKLQTVFRSLALVESWEIIFVDDGSTDGTQVEIEKLCKSHENVTLISFKRNFGKSAALIAGFKEASGDIIITMDGDLQDEPSEIPKLLEGLSTGYDLVSGWKKERNDPLEKRWPSKLFNFFVSRLTGIKLHDFNCGFKSYRAWCIKDIRLSGNLYRFLPVLVAQRGGRILEVAVKHNARAYGKSKYGYKRYFHGIADLFTIMLLTRFFNHPLYFFGMLSMPIIFLGTSIGLFLLGNHIYYLFSGDVTSQLKSRPLLEISVMLFMVGIQLFFFGLLAELILNLSDNRFTYIVDRKVRRKKGTIKDVSNSSFFSGEGDHLLRNPMPLDN